MSRKSSLSDLGGLVYSTDSGRMCPACRQAIADCVCAQARAAPAGDGTARVSCDTKGRRGKAVTVVRGLALEQAEMADLARALKTACGVGGTLKDGVIELQGEHVERVLAELAARSLRAKRSG